MNIKAIDVERRAIRLCQFISPLFMRVKIISVAQVEGIMMAPGTSNLAINSIIVDRLSGFKNRSG